MLGATVVWRGCGSSRTWRRRFPSSPVEDYFLYFLTAGVLWCSACVYRSCRFPRDLFCQRLRNTARSQVCSSQLPARHKCTRQEVLARPTSRASPRGDRGRRDAQAWDVGVHEGCAAARRIRLQLAADAYFSSSPFDPVGAVSSPDLPLLFQAVFALRRTDGDVQPKHLYFSLSVF